MIIKCCVNSEDINVDLEHNLNWFFENLLPPEHLKDFFNAVAKQALALQVNSIQFQNLASGICNFIGPKLSIDEAIEHLGRAIPNEEDFSKIWYYLGAAFFERAQFKQAKDCFKTAINLEPKIAEYYIASGQVALAQDLPRAAIKHFDTAIKIDKDNPIGHHLIGKAFSLIDEHNQALISYNTATLLKLQNPELHFDKIKAYAKLDKKEPAEKQFNSLFNQKGVTAKALVELGKTWYECFYDKQKATECFQHAIKLEPTKGAVVKNVGIAYSRMGMEKEAVANLIIASKLHGYGDGEIFYYLATLSNANNGLDPLVLIQAALSQDQTNPKYYCLRGQLNYSRGKLVEAKDDFMTVLKLAPHSFEGNLSRDYFFKLQSLSDDQLLKRKLENTQSLEKLELEPTLVAKKEKESVSISLKQEKTEMNCDEYWYDSNSNSDVESNSDEVTTSG